jgi:hypothetical protein
MRRVCFADRFMRENAVIGGITAFQSDSIFLVFHFPLRKYHRHSTPGRKRCLAGEEGFEQNLGIF